VGGASLDNGSKEGNKDLLNNETVQQKGSPKVKFQESGPRHVGGGPLKKKKGIFSPITKFEGRKAKKTEESKTWVGEGWQKFQFNEKNQKKKRYTVRVGVRRGLPRRSSQSTHDR